MWAYAKRFGHQKLCFTLVVTLSSSLQTRNNLSSSPGCRKMKREGKKTPEGASEMQRLEEKEQEGSRLRVITSGVTGSHIRDEGGVMR